MKSKTNIYMGEDIKTHKAALAEEIKPKKPKKKAKKK